MTPFCSVIVPLFNRSTYLHQCLSSILRQPIGGEVLIWDDHSTVDPAPQIHAILQEVMPPNCPWDVQYHRQAKNLGMFRNFNDAIFSAKGEWVHILCEDDFVAPQFYTVMQQALAGQPDTAGAACCGYANLYEPSHFLDKRPLLMPTAGVLPKDSWNDCLRACNPLQIPAVVFRRSALRAVGGFRTDFPFVGDMELYQRLAKRYQWYYVPQYMSVFRMHEESQSSELGRQGRLEGDVARLQEMVESTLLKENR